MNYSNQVTVWKYQTWLMVMFTVLPLQEQDREQEGLTLVERVQIMSKQSRYCFFLWFFSWTKSFSCHSWWINHHLVQQWAYSIMAGFGHAEPQLWSKNIEQNAFMLAFLFGLNDCMSRAAYLWRGLKVNIKIIWHIASTRQELWN